MNKKSEQRISKIKRKYGANCFKRFGSRGGNPDLLKLATGDYKVVKK